MTSRQHYDATEEEKSILVPAIQTYFNYQPRSEERNSIITQLLEKLQKINPDHWNTTNVRVWLRNNQKNFSNLSQGINTNPFFEHPVYEKPIPPEPQKLIPSTSSQNDSIISFGPLINSDLKNLQKETGNSVVFSFPLPRSPSIPPILDTSSRPVSPWIFDNLFSRPPSTFNSDMSHDPTLPPKKGSFLDSTNPSRQPSLTPSIETKKYEPVAPLELIIPTVPDNLQENQFDSIKNEMHSILKKLLAGITRLSTNEYLMKSAEQLQHEAYMNQILDIMFKKLHLKRVHVTDDESSYIMPSTVDNTQQNQMVLIKTLTTHPKNIPPKLVSLYKGSSSINMQTIDNFICAYFGTEATITITGSENQYIASCCGRTFKLQETQPKTVFIDENKNRLWINYGTTVSSYKLQNIREQPEGEITITPEYSVQVPPVDGAVCNLNDFVFTLSSGSLIKTNLSNSSPPVPIDLRLNENPLLKPDMMTSHHSSLFIASKDYHTVYVYDYNLSIQERLVGHTGNINFMHCSNNLLFVGATDQFVRIYDANSLLLMTIIDTTDFMPSSASAGKLNEFPIVFLGGCSNGRCSIRVYDVNQKAFISEIFTENQIPTLINFDSENFVLEVLCQDFEKKGESVVVSSERPQVAKSFFISYFVTRSF